VNSSRQLDVKSSRQLDVNSSRQLDVNSSRQLNGECERGREWVEVVEEGRGGKWGSLEKNSFLFWKLPAESSVRQIVNRLITSAFQNLVLISSDNEMKYLELEHNSTL
jgi:hypothetical protein